MNGPGAPYNGIGPGVIEDEDDIDDEDYDDSPDDREAKPPPSSYDEFWSDPCWSEPI